MTPPDPDVLLSLEDIDLFDADAYRTGSPHAALRTLREKAPMWRHERSGQPAFWCVTKYDTVARLLKDTKRFSSTHGNILDIAEQGDSAGGHTLPLMDPPDHSYVRGPAFRTMSNLVMRDRTAKTRNRLRLLLDPCLQGGTVNFAHLMLDLPMLAVGEIIGIPEEFWPELPSLTMAGIAPRDPVYSAGSDGRTLAKAHMRLFAIFGDLLEQRRRRPQDDLISVLLSLDFGGRKLTDHQVMLNCYSMVMGANTTTPHVASHLIHAMASDPAAWHRIRNHPDLVESTVIESVRWATPTNHVMRRVTMDTEVDGIRIAEGDIVALWISSANRDELVFPDPYRFDPGRAPNPQLAFAVGPHYCVGAPAAKAVLGLLVREIARHVDEFEVTGPVRHLASNFINGLTTLPVRFHVAEQRLAG